MRVSPADPSVSEFVRPSAVLPMMIWWLLKSVTPVGSPALSYVSVTVGVLAQVAAAGSVICPELPGQRNFG